MACKKIVITEEFHKERENLTVLKKSIRSHGSVMLHDFTIEHGPNHYILFPYAEYGDLEQFLHCGIAPGTKKQRYEWTMEFKDFAAKTSLDKMLDMFHQCANLADAIKWLHEDITVGDNNAHMFCAHMDLKPANILITKSQARDARVGHWMISDFGISAFKEDQELQSPKFATIRDYYITMKEQPQRGEGTYQAPEVCDPMAFPHTHWLDQVVVGTGSQGVVGRKSDIWSFGCILSEILTFSLGQSVLIKEFQKTRKSWNISKFDDLFHLKTRKELLHPNQHNEYEIRPGVTEWHDRLCKDFPDERSWIMSCVILIRNILIVDPSKRPNAKSLLKLVNSTHGSLTGLPEDNQRLRQGVDSSHSDLRHLISRSSEEDTISSNSSNPPVLISQTWRSTSYPRLTVIPDRSIIRQQTQAEEFKIVLDAMSTHRPKTVRKIGKKAAKTIDIAISPSGGRVAYLFNESNSTIGFYQINLEQKQVHSEARHEIHLNSSQPWTKVALAGEFLAVWGKYKIVSLYLVP
jgi:serine/threonine protein kinase